MQHGHDQKCEDEDDRRREGRDILPQIVAIMRLESRHLELVFRSEKMRSEVARAGVRDSVGWRMRSWRDDGIRCDRLFPDERL